MKTRKIVAAIAAASLALGSVGAFAQPRNEHRGDDRAEQRHDERHDQRDNLRRDQRYEHRYESNTHRGDDRDRGFGHDGDRYRPEYRRDGRGAGPDHSFYRGGHLPAQYRSHQYVVNDWRGHHLSPPPRGYHWVQAGGDYLLVAVATGIIASILLNQ